MVSVPAAEKGYCDKCGKNLAECACELSLDDKKARAAGDYRDAVARFSLESSETFTAAMGKMKGMDHGPNHGEGDPLVHTQLVVFETARAFRTAGDNLSESDLELLQLAAVLHDIGKAGTQKYDVVSGKQNETVGASPEQVDAAGKWVNNLLAEVSGQILEGLSKSNIRKLMEEHSAQMQGRIKEELPGAGDDVRKAIAANFRGHDDKSVEMLPAILEQSGAKLSDGQKADLAFVVEHHMLLLNPGDVRLPKFKELFVSPDGRVDERKLDLLRIMTLGDDAASVRPGETPEQKRAFRGQVDSAITKLKLELEAEAEKARKEAVAKEFEKSIFGGSSMAEYVTGRGIPQGKDFGRAMGMLKKELARLRTENPSMIAEQIKAALDAVALS